MIHVYEDSKNTELLNTIKGPKKREVFLVAKSLVKLYKSM